MSGLVGPAGLDIAAGLALDVVLKVSVPLAVGLLASALPGSAASRHARLTLALGAVPVVAVATAAARGSDAALTDAPQWPLVVWALGAAFGLTYLLRSVVALGRLPVIPTHDGLERCALLRSPMTAGWLRPRVLVPLDFDAWTPTHRAAALAHERAHVQRRDWLVQTCVWALGAILWFHPLMALARRRLALLAECAADDAVLAQGHDPVPYAELLVRLGHPGPVGGLALGPSMVGVRVRHLLADRPRQGASVWPLVAGALLTAAATPSVAALAPWSAPAPIAGCSPGPAGPDAEATEVWSDDPLPWSETWSDFSSL
jgi:hypothetical protein